MLRLEGLEKTYENGFAQKVLKGIDLEVIEGEFLALTGKSGSGKSTLLYQIGLLDYPSAGAVKIDGIDMGKIGSSSRSLVRLHKLGFIFQDYALLPELTALENVVVPLLMRGESKTIAYQKAQRALERVGLGHRLANTPAKLSGGEQQRVSIARAVAGHPKLLLADEPTANLDTENGAIVMDLLHQLHEEGQTIILVTHEEEFAQRAPRRLVMSDGLIIKETRRGS